MDGILGEIQMNQIVDAASPLLVIGLAVLGGLLGAIVMYLLLEG